MTSAITPNTISANFPVEGQDNPSQGFRTNFGAIASNFTTAASEISALQSVALLKADLATQSTPVVNNLLGSTISNGLYQLFSGTMYTASGVSGAVNIDLSQGAVQKFTLSGNTTLTFATTGSTTGFPNYTGVPAVYSSAIILIQSDGTGVYTPTFATTGGTIGYDTSFPINPSTGTPGINVGGESLASVAVSNAGSGYTSLVTISFSGGSPLTNAIAPTATASYTVVGASATNLGIFTAASTLSPTIATTGASGTGATATLTFANTQSTNVPPYAVGQTIVVSGVTPTTYNGTFIVTACTYNSVSYASTAAGSQSVAGTISGGVAGNGYALNDLVALSSNTSVIFSVETLATTFTATTTSSSATLNNIYNFTNLVTGMAINGVGIPSNTTISTINIGFPGSIIMSNQATITSSGSIVVTYTSNTGPIGTLSSFPTGTLATPVSGLRSFITLTGAGSGARLAVNCGLGAITVTNPGDGYTSVAPTVSVTGGGGTLGQATAILTSGTQLKTQMVQAWTINGGANVYLRYMGQY